MIDQPTITIDDDIPEPPPTKPGPKRSEAQTLVITKALLDGHYLKPYAKAKAYLQEYKQIVDPAFDVTLLDVSEHRNEVKNFAKIIRAAIQTAQTK